MSEFQELLNKIVDSKTKIESELAPLYKKMENTQEEINLLRKRKEEISTEIKNKSKDLPELKRQIAALSKANGGSSLSG